MYKLLIVDDEEIERRAIEYVVDRTDLKISEIMQAPNGKEAVAAASVFEPDIVLMDINMPGLNGIKATQIIKKINKDIHVVFLTAFDEFDYAKQAIKLGADDFIVKPATTEVLQKTLENVIGEIEKEREFEKRTMSAKERLNDASEYMKECLIEALISGESDKRKIEKFCSFTNMTYFEYAFGAVIEIKIKNEMNLSSKEMDLKRQMVVNRISKRIKNEIDNCIVCSRKNSMYFLGYCAEYGNIVDSQGRLQLIVDKLSSQALVGIGVSLELVIGPICNEVDKIWTSFSKAKEIIKTNRIELLTDDTKGLLNLIADEILEGDKRKLLELVNETQSNLVEDSISIEDYRNKLLGFAIKLKQELDERLNNNLDFNDSLYLITTKAKNEEDGKDFLIYFTDKLYNVCSLESNDKNAIIVNRLKSYIEENINENITLDQLADMGNFSPFYLSKLFKKHLNMNFSDYITYVRIKKAKKLLKETLLSVKEISHDVGYSDPNYFTRVFKKETGISPTKYKRDQID